MYFDGATVHLEPWPLSYDDYIRHKTNDLDNHAASNSPAPCYNIKVLAPFDQGLNLLRYPACASPSIPLQLCLSALGLRVLEICIECVGSVTQRRRMLRCGKHTLQHEQGPYYINV